MQPINPRATRYDTTTIVFHWIVALLVVEQWLGAQVIDWFSRGAPRVDARSVHIVTGAILGILLIWRIFWRLTRGRRLPPMDRGSLGLIAKAVHWALYAAVAGMVVVGIILEWARGDNIFNVFSIPAYDPGNHALANRIQDIHAAIGWVIVALVGAHTLAALFHHFIRRDGTLARMLPRA